jgi:hypothetical protein
VRGVQKHPSKCSFGVGRGGCETQLWSRKCSSDLPALSSTLLIVSIQQNVPQSLTLFYFKFNFYSLSIFAIAFLGVL